MPRGVGLGAWAALEDAPVVDHVPEETMGFSKGNHGFSIQWILFLCLP